MDAFCGVRRGGVGGRTPPNPVSKVRNLVQSKPVYSNYFFAARNGKKEPIVRKNR